MNYFDQSPPALEESPEFIQWESLAIAFDRELSPGDNTNFGTLTRYDQHGTAHFTRDGRAGWVGRDARHLIQRI